MSKTRRQLGIVIMQEDAIRQKSRYDETWELKRDFCGKGHSERKKARFS
jgi:hypothetical protein